MTPQQILEWIIDNPTANVHWTPQHVNRVPFGTIVPVEKLAFRVHTSDGDVPEYDSVALMQHYEKDNWLRHESLDPEGARLWQP